MRNTSQEDIEMLMREWFDDCETVLETAKLYATNNLDYYNEYVMRTCPICGKEFMQRSHWAYKHKNKWCCSYTCYVQAGGDGGLDRLNGKKQRYYNNTKGAR